MKIFPYRTESKKRVIKYFYCFYIFVKMDK